MHRRTWLRAISAPWLARNVAGASLASGMSGLWLGAAGAADAPPGTVAETAPRFLLVFLRGGYDGLSALVPAQRGFYDEVRQDIALPAESLRRLDADWALHPALAGALSPLLDQGQVAFVPYAGTPNDSRSHFETQDSIELGLGERLLAGEARRFDSGFLNRLLQQLGEAPAIGFTDRLPLSLSGALQVPNVSLKSPARAGDTAALRAGLLAMYGEHSLRRRVETGFSVRDEVARELAAEKARTAANMAPATAPASAPATAAPSSILPSSSSSSSSVADAAARVEMAASRQAIAPKGFELEARRMGNLMRTHYRVGFVDVGGWDTHYNQGAATGALADRLGDVGRGLAGFADALGPVAWGQTVVVVLSEFGRTVRQNGTRGTDHGHGTTYWVLGGGLRSGQGMGPVRGEQVVLSAATLYQNRDLPVLNDYRTVLAGLWARQFGLGPAALNQVFAGVAPRDLGLV